MRDIKKILIYLITIAVTFSIGMVASTYICKIPNQLCERNVAVLNQCNCTNESESKITGPPENILQLKKGVYYNPLKNIYWNDKFNNGLAGWDIYKESKGSVFVGYLPNERNQTLTRGGLSGEKVMIIQDGTAIKRTSWLWKNKTRIEFWYVAKNFYNPAPDNNPDHLTKFITFMFDTQIGVPPGDYYRASPAIRFRNLGYNDEILHQWEYISGNGADNKGIWVPLPGNPIQELTWNEKYKYDWVYFRLDIDLEQHEYIEFQSNDRIWNLRGIKLDHCILCGEKTVLNNLLNFAFTIESKEPTKPSILAIDSVIMSADN